MRGAKKLYQYLDINSLKLEKNSQHKLLMQNKCYVMAWEFSLNYLNKIPAKEATFTIADFFIFVVSLLLNIGIKYLFKIATGRQLILIKSII